MEDLTKYTDEELRVLAQERSRGGKGNYTDRAEVAYALLRKRHNAQCTMGSGLYKTETYGDYNTKKVWYK